MQFFSDTDADIQGVVIAFHRKGTGVVEEVRARQVAASLNALCINKTVFFEEVHHKLFNLHDSLNSLIIYHIKFYFDKIFKATKMTKCSSENIFYTHPIGRHKHLSVTNKK